MRDVVTRWKHFLSPDFLNPDFHDFLPALVFPDVAHDLLIPGFAHLTTSVEALNVLEADHQHDVTKQEVRHRVPSSISIKHAACKHNTNADLHCHCLSLDWCELKNDTEDYYQHKWVTRTSHYCEIDALIIMHNSEKKIKKRGKNRTKN